MDTGQLCSAWAAAIAGLNDDDLTTMEELLAADCVFEHAGRSRDEIIAGLKQGRADGWLRHDILSLSAAGSVMATTARNSYADGSDSYVAGVARFNDDGQIFHMVAIDERPGVPTTPG